MTDIDTANPAAIMIQPSMLPDLELPYPYYINPDGGVARQDFWKGKPATLVGFQDRVDVQTVDLLCEDFLAAPELAVGKYPVFADEDGDTFWTSIPAIDSVARGA